MSINAYILFKVSSGTERDVCNQLVELKEIVTASRVYGEYDIIAKIAVPDMNALETFIPDKIRKIPSVMISSTLIIAREYKGKNNL